MIVRPPAIYGPGDRETFPLFRAAQSSPVMIAPADPKARLALAHVDDVAAVIADLAKTPRPGARVTVAGHRPEGYAWTEIANAAGEVFGRRVPFVGIPGSVLTMAARASEAIADMRRVPQHLHRGKGARDFASRLVGIGRRTG